jgi:flagellin
MNRINYETEFNGERIFPVDWERSKKVQTGVNDGDSIEIDLKPVSALDFFGYKSGFALWSDTPTLVGPAASPPANPTTGTEFYINGVAHQARITISEGDSAQSIASKVNDAAVDTGVFARADTWLYLSADDPLFHSEVSLKVNGIATSSFSFHYQNLEVAINDIEEQTGVVASSFDGGVVLFNGTGADIQVEFDGPGEINAWVEQSQTETLISAGNDSITVSGAVKFMSSADFSISNVDSNPSTLFDSNPSAADSGILSTTNEEIRAYSGDFVVNDYLKGANVEYAPDLTLVVAKSAIQQIVANRSEIGALTNRFEYVVSNLLNISEQTSAARSLIADADFAIEAARLAKAQVLQQSSTAILAQANAQPQLALSLIR